MCHAWTVRPPSTLPTTRPPPLPRSGHASPESGQTGRGGCRTPLPSAPALTPLGQESGFDIVFDTVGGPVLDASFEAVRTHTGHVVSALGWGTHALAPLSFRGATYSGVLTLLPMLTGQGRAHHGEILREVAALVDDGKLRPLLDATRYTLADAANAHQAVQSGTAEGKVVVHIEP
ncbi:zinc-binding dehydrogenase [Streptomyces nigra]|uniref:zinc-binding dehydrogenase n=1 Tax=Streptomyces nigra TaxID=1827580 RepID=UPI0035D86923